MIKTFLITLLLSITISHAQSRTEIAAYNIGLGSVFGGFGAIINKKPDEKTGKVFLKGFWQGALGGYLIYESKNLVSKIPKKKLWEYSWAAKFTNAAGTSIVENAASNRNFWEQWHFNIGFSRIEIYTKNKFSIKYKVMPISFVLTAVTFAKNKFRFSRSLQTGEFIFSNTNMSSNAYVLGNVMVIKDENFEDYSIFSHELIHIYQYYDYNSVNAFLNKPIYNLRKKSKTFRLYNNWLYLDLNGPVLRSLYLIENINQDCYYDNFFEYEADFFARGRRINCD